MRAAHERSDRGDSGSVALLDHVCRTSTKPLSSGDESAIVARGGSIPGGHAAKVGERRLPRLLAVKGYRQTFKAKPHHPGNRREGCHRYLKMRFGKELTPCPQRWTVTHTIPKVLVI